MRREGWDGAGELGDGSVYERRIGCDCEEEWSERAEIYTYSYPWLLAFSYNSVNKPKKEQKLQNRESR